MIIINMELKQRKTQLINRQLKGHELNCRNFHPDRNHGTRRWRPEEPDRSRLLRPDEFGVKHHGGAPE